MCGCRFQLSVLLCCSVSLASIWIAGCGSSESELETIRVQGTLHVDSKPYGPVKVIFTSLDATMEGPRPLADGEVDENGSFELTTYSSGDGIPEGKYMVSLYFEDMIDNLGSQVHTKDYTAEITKPDSGTLKLLVELETDPEAKGGAPNPELGEPEGDEGALTP